jgi:hypothetical protein
MDLAKAICGCPLCDITKVVKNRLQKRSWSLYWLDVLMSMYSLAQGSQRKIIRVISGHELCDIGAQSQVEENVSKEYPWKQCKHLILVMLTRARATYSAYPTFHYTNHPSLLFLTTLYLQLPTSAVKHRSARVLHLFLHKSNFFLHQTITIPAADKSQIKNTSSAAKDARFRNFPELLLSHGLSCWWNCS